MGFSPTALPREFHKGLFEDFSRDFLIILLVSLLFHTGLIVLLINAPFIKIHQPAQIHKIQDQYVNLVLKKSPLSDTLAMNEENVPITPGDRTAASDKEQRTGSEEADRRAGISETGNRAAPSETRTTGSYSASARGRSRDQILRDARSIGILGLITSSGGSEKAAEIDRLLGEGGGTATIDQVLSELDGLRSRESAGGGVEAGKEIRGTRTTEGGSIDGIVQELGDAKSTNITRTGELVVAPIAELTKEGDVTRLAGRNPDQVSAVVNSHIGAIQYLYELQLRRNPDLKGKLVVRFTINPEGKITKVTIVSSTLNDEQLVNRIVRRMLQWDDFGAINASMGDAVFRQVFTFGF